MTLQPFNFNGSEVRTITDNKGEPWFVAVDVCRVLDIKNSRQAIDQVDPDDVSNTYVTDSLGREQGTNIVNESGLYQLIFVSRKPEAKAFKRWITHEVLPAIRKTGKYETPKLPTLEESLLAQQELAATALRLLKDNQRLELQNAEMQPKAEFADALVCSEGCVSFEVAAKTLKLPFGRNTLIKKLREDGYLYKKDGSNIPYQQYVDSGHFEVTTGLHARSTGAEPHHTTYVTPKGLLLVHKQYGGKTVALAAA